jgi:hypothetical protein
MELNLAYKNGKLELSSEDFEMLQKENKSFNTKMHKMVDHLLCEDNLEKENLEICQVGKFLVLLDEDIS